MISFWRQGFGPDSSWEVDGVPSGSYRITLRAAREVFAGGSSYDDEYWMTCRMGEIVFFATPSPVFALDPSTVQALLDIHEAVYPHVRHPSAHVLLQARRYGNYLHEVGRDLETAIRHRLLHVEKFERPWPFPDAETETEQGKAAGSEELLPVEFQVFGWEDRAPLANVSAIVRYPDGREVEHTTDTNGRVIVFGKPNQKFDLIRVLDPQEEQHFSLGTHSSSSRTA